MLAKIAHTGMTPSVRAARAAGVVDSQPDSATGSDRGRLMSWQRLRRWLQGLCGLALLALFIFAAPGCDLAGPTKGPEYEKGHAYGVETARHVGGRDRKYFSGPAPSPPSGKSDEWVRGYREGWKAGIQSQPK